jgi:hypothetical protein
MLDCDYCSNTYTILLNWKDWREYEHIHTLAWLGKDYAWVRILPPLWVLCLVPTILIAIDFIWTTWKTKVAVHLDGDRLCTNYSYPLFLSTALQRMVIDCAHYVAQLIWVIGETNNKQLLV